MIQFSLILPVYKVRDYIGACLESCCKQEGFSPSDYEIIIVNDGSPDDSIDVARKVMKNYPQHNFKIAERENGGLSAARNSGIPAAQGLYVWFIDSDDYIDSHALQKLSEAAAKGDYDIITFCHKLVKMNGEVVFSTSAFEPYTCTGYEYLSCTGFLSACTGCYRLDRLQANSLQFKEGVIWEDSEFNLRAYALAKKVYCMSDELYYYVRRGGSISNSNNILKSTKSRISNIESVYTFHQQIHTQGNNLKIIYKHLTSSLIFTMAGLPELEEADRKTYRKEIQKKMPFYRKLAFQSLDIKGIAVVLLYTICPSFTEKILNNRTHAAIKRSTT